jgi:glycosyltransferase involved in cell wall biosynthesis
LNKRKSILIFSEWYLPGFRAGGPIRSVANLVSRLDADFFIVTTNHDHASTTPYQGIQPNEWVKGSSGEIIIYLTGDQVNKQRFRTLMTERTYDKIYLNSLFSPSFALLPLRVAKAEKLLDRLILAPRGMLKPGALSVKKHKKSLFLKFAQLTGLYKGITWHATNQEEVDEVLSSFPGSHVKVAPNLVGPSPQPVRTSPKNSRELKLITVARVSPEKNILDAIHFLGKALNTENHVEWAIYGILQNNGYTQLCKEAAAMYPRLKITFEGDLSHQFLSEKLYQSHFFYLPTLGENYGHAIVEAFTVGLPVIISQGTPWRQLTEKKAGWDVELDSDDFEKVLRIAYEMGSEDHEILCDGAYAFGQKIIYNPADLESNLALFLS